MPNYDYDLFVIGAGSGGVRCSRIAAQYGARVAVAEQQELGGACVNSGCIPKKLLMYAAQCAEEIARAKTFGWQTNSAPTFDWQILSSNKNQEIKRLNDVYQKLLQKAGVHLIRGMCTLCGPHEVRVANHNYSAKHIVIATGSRPFVPNISGHELGITSDEFFQLEKFPKRALIVGGGYIAVELASILQGLGARTSILYRGNLFLKHFDEDLRVLLRDAYHRKGIELVFNAQVQQITTSNSALQVQDDRARLWDTDLVLFATSRKPNIEKLGLESLALEMVGGLLKINQHFQTSTPSIYAIGDVASPLQLTPVAIAQGEALAHHLCANTPPTLKLEQVPTAVFSLPNLATVGLTEIQARQNHGKIHVFKSTFTSMHNSLGHMGAKVFIKLIVDEASDLVLGCHMLGPAAGEIIQCVAIALRAGLTKAQFDETLAIHPTMAEELVTMRQPLTA